MPNIAALVGLLLSLLGPIFYFLGQPGARSLTAFIPLPFGLLILGAGLAARHPARRKHAMHLAAVLSLIALLGSLMGAKNFPKLLSGQAASLPRPLATTEQFLMFVICLVFLVLCINWFISNRRKPKEA
jgi:hypothetical protein